ncbi:MAG: hypothetical protein JNK59_01010 [Sterolibacteriaceae bacterium]|nr:hypothetical protein [Sterolibacteriaceae bacterium]MBN8474045.1 hypothetical protein [Sulfuritalea sp.]
MTKLDRPAEDFWDKLYCQRSDAENRIKETQLDFSACARVAIGSWPCGCW